MKDPRYRLLEMLVLFVVFPSTLALNYAVWIKVFIGIFGFAYIVWILVRIEKIKIFRDEGIPWKLFWQSVALTLPIILVVTTVYVWLVAPQHLFFVPFQNPLLFGSILLVYGILSVWPQEILYRTFFFQRYGEFFQHKNLLILVNASLFSLAHIFFRNTLVLLLTFIGGILFGLTYLKFKSTLLVTIEHTIYGNWLFTVGMGNMLGFPGMEN